MRYQVHLINNPNPLTVDATEFHPMSGGVIFYKDRMRSNGMNDTWGNPRRVPTRVAVAFMTNVESILEIPEEDEVAPQVDFEAGAPTIGATTVDGIRWTDNDVALWVDEAGPNLLRRNFAAPPELPGPPIGIDGDNVPWDAQQHE